MAHRLDVEHSTIGTMSRRAAEALGRAHAGSATAELNAASPALRRQETP